jgi:hypothetical protein
MPSKTIDENFFSLSYMDFDESEKGYMNCLQSKIRTVAAMFEIEEDSIEV